MRKVLLSMALCLGAAFFAANVNAQNKVGFVNVAASAADIFDEDEKAAAQWFITTYGGEYLPVSEITPEKLNEYSALWIYVDDDYYAGLPDELLEENVLSAITNWYKAGGNLLLSTFGSIYLKEVGRVNCEPTVNGTGVASDNADIWYASPTHGTIEGTTLVIDYSADPIYAGLTSETIVRDNGLEYVHYPLVDGGVKEDHNSFWAMGEDPEIGDLGAGNPIFLTTFRDKWAMQPLAIWDHVQDYYGAAIARWNPQGDYSGTAITIGIAAYQWAKAGNVYSSNVERLTKNALDELKGNGTGIKPVFNHANIVETEIFNLSGISLPADNVQSLPKGVYILKQTDSQGAVNSKKIIR